MQRTVQMEENAHFAARERIVDLDVSYKNSSFPTHLLDILINLLICLTVIGQDSGVRSPARRRSRDRP